MRYAVFDIEADELLKKVTKVHCFSYEIWENSILLSSGTLTHGKDIQAFCNAQSILVGHNIILYDIPTLKKVLGITVGCRLIDTLPLSWYLYPMRKTHGLEDWGEDLGVAKPVITDWKNLSLTEYIHRCETDVVINRMLFKKQLQYLQLIYQERGIDGIFNYLMFKQDCMLEQFYNPLRIDLPRCQATINVILPLIEDKRAALEAAMPTVTKYKIRRKPKKCNTKDGELSKLGAAWYNLLFEMNLDPSIEEIKVIDKVEQPKASSPAQVKEWLFSLGWEPTIFDYKKNADGEVRAIPQISDKEKNLCPNILALIEQYPEVENLAGLNMLKHRLGILEGFLECSDENGFIIAETLGLTNTLRFKHIKPIVNLPGVEKPYGKEIRACIIAPDEDHIFCGSDMSSLEDTTKQHYMYFYDPEYVKEMRVPGFDPHIDIGVQGGMLTKAQEEFFKWYNKKVKENPEAELDTLFTPGEIAEYKAIVRVRKDSKVVNFSAVYGVGAPKMSLGTKWTLEKSQSMLKIYWERNKAVKLIARDTTVRVVFNNGTIADYLGAQLMDMKREIASAFQKTILQMWLLNPVSGLYYSLRYPKDIFSTLNQGTGVYCFDTQIRNVRKRGIKISLQYHDEEGFPLLRTEKEEVRAKLYDAIRETNEQLKLNVPLGISVDFGDNYADCH